MYRPVFRLGDYVRYRRIAVPPAERGRRPGAMSGAVGRVCRIQPRADDVGEVRYGVRWWLPALRCWETARYHYSALSLLPAPHPYLGGHAPDYRRPDRDEDPTLLREGADGRPANVGTLAVTARHT